MKGISIKQGLLPVILAVTVSLFAVVAFVNATTTISTNIVTGGSIAASTTLQVTGAQTNYGAFTVSGTGATTLGGALSAAGVASFAGVVNASSTVNVTGAQTNYGALTVSGTGATTLGGTLGVTGVTSLADILNASSTVNTTGLIKAYGGAESSVTRATGATGSFQNFAGDLTYEGAAGGTSSYHAGVMGNFMGASLTNTNPAMHAGVIGKYSVTGGDTSAGPQAGLVGETETDFADAAIMAVLSGTGATPNAAYGVQYLTITSGAFDYGIDLSHAQTVGLGAETIVSYGTADIRLSAGNHLISGSAATRAAVETAFPAAPIGSIYVSTDAGRVYVKVTDAGANTDWQRVTTTAAD